MPCSNCNSTKLPCGCDDQALTTPPPCDQNSTACPNPDECPETFSAACTVWTGQDLICNTTVVAQAGMRMDAVIENMIALFCGPAGSTPPQEAITLSVPLPIDVLFGADDHNICIDRVNCFSDITLAFDGSAPTGIQFITLGPVLSTTLTLTPDLSCIHFDLDISAITDPPGVYNYNITVTGCGSTLLVPATITIP